MMSRKLLLENFEQLNLETGIPPGFAAHAISAAQYFHAKGAWGTLFLQEIQTPKYLFRHFFFSLKHPISFFNEDENNRLQSLLNIKGHFDFEIQGQEKFELKEKGFLLFVTAGQTTLTTVHKGNSSLLNAHYAPALYQDLVPYFTSLKEDLKKAVKNGQYFLRIGTKARDSVHDAIKAIWKEKYIPVLLAKQVELHLESSLFAMFAQSYDAASPANISPDEKRFAEEAERLMLQNLKVHLTTKEIALELNCSPSWLRTAFRKVYGIPMFRFLRRNKMHYAREQILNGASLKAVAIELGMNPSNFPNEFKSFFGYTVTSLKKGLH